MNPATVVLMRARQMVAGGWAGPEDEVHSCWDTDGRMCRPDAEMVDRFSLAGAIRIAAGLDDTARIDAWDFFERIVDPIGWAEGRLLAGSIEDFEAARNVRALLMQLRAPRGLSAFAWLQHKGRTAGELLRALDRAILRSKGER